MIIKNTFLLYFSILVSIDFAFDRKYVTSSSQLAVLSVQCSTYKWGIEGADCKHLPQKTPEYYKNTQQIILPDTCGNIFVGSFSFF